VVLGTWSTLALLGGAAVLLQIPYSLFAADRFKNPTAAGIAG
jgi:hypothetical protein